MEQTSCGSRTLSFVSEDNTTIHCVCTVCSEEVSIQKARYSKKALRQVRDEIQGYDNEAN